MILYLAWFLDQKRRNKAAMEFCKQDFLQTILPAAGPVLIYVCLILLQPDHGHGRGHRPGGHDDPVCSRDVLEMDRRGDSHTSLPIIYLLITHVAIATRA